MSLIVTMGVFVALGLVAMIVSTWHACTHETHAARLIFLTPAAVALVD